MYHLSTWKGEGVEVGEMGVEVGGRWEGGVEVETEEYSHIHKYTQTQPLTSSPLLITTMPSMS